MLVPAYENPAYYSSVGPAQSNPKEPLSYYKHSPPTAPVVVRSYTRRLPAIPDHPERRKVRSHETVYRRLPNNMIARTATGNWVHHADQAEAREEVLAGGRLRLGRPRKGHTRVMPMMNPAYYSSVGASQSNPSQQEYSRNTKTLLFSSVLLFVFTVVAQVANSRNK